MFLKERRSARAGAHRRWMRAALPLPFLMALSSCSQDLTRPPPGIALAVRADVSATAVVTVVIEVTAADITTPLAFNIPVVSGVANGTIAAPLLNWPASGKL